MLLIHALPAIAVLVPGLWLWWTGRALLRRLDDPALAERVLLRQQRLVMVTTVCVVLLVLNAGRHFPWMLLALVVVLLAGGYPSRRALQQERWGLLAYLRFNLGALAGAIGFWVLLAFAPQIVVAAGRWSGPVRLDVAAAAGAVLLVVLLAWEVGYGALWLRGHRAVPFARARRWTGEPLAEADALLARFAAVAARAGLPMPRVYAYGVVGGRLTNALALPSRRPVVAFGNGMLDGFDADELTAIFAHELAHLEDYGPRRLRRLQLAGWALVVVAVALPLAALATVPASAGWVSALVPLVVFLFVGSRTARRQAEETSSDLRAVEWTGDAEALVRGLEKLHAQVHIPRRMPGEVERSATHPSLARRIQAIRLAAGGVHAAGAGATEQAAAAPTVLRGAAAGSWIALDAARAHWIEGAAADAASGDARGGASVVDLDAARRTAASYRTVQYGDLAELRVDVSTAQPVLRAVDRAGRTWDFPLHADEVAAAQRALDRVDARLSRAERVLPRGAVGLAASAVVLSMMAGLEFGLATLPAIITLFRPSTASTAAMGATAVLAALVAAVHGVVVWSAALHALAQAAMAVAGVWALWLVWRRLLPLSPHPQLAAPGATYALVGGSTLFLLARAAPTLGGLSVATLPDARALAALAVCAGGLGAALAVSGRRTTRHAGGALLAGAAAVVLATVAPQAANRLQHRVRWSEGAAHRVAAVAVHGSAYSVALSPSGRRFAALALDERGDGVEHYLVGDSAGVHHRVQARDLAFVGDDSLLVLAGTGDSLELRLLARRDTSLVPLWRRPMPALGVATITVDAPNGAWRIHGRLDAGPLYLASGDLAGATLVPQPAPPLDRYGYPVLATESGALLVAAPAGQSARMLAASRRLPVVTTLLAMPRGGWEVWRMGSGEPRRIAGELMAAPECDAGARPGETVCVATSRTRAQAWQVSADGAIVRGAMLPANLGLARPASAGRVLAVTDAGDALLVDAATERGRRIPLDDAGVYVMDADARGGMLAVLVSGGAGGMEVRLYRVR